MNIVPGGCGYKYCAGRMWVQILCREDVGTNIVPGGCGYEYDLSYIAKCLHHNNYALFVCIVSFNYTVHMYTVSKS